ncbi:MAG: DUF3267 domain-containing protein [Bacteroidota bacterium]
MLHFFWAFPLFRSVGFTFIRHTDSYMPMGLRFTSSAEFLQPEQLHAGSYRLVDTLGFGDLLPFLQNQMGQSNLITRLYYRFLFLFLFWMIGLVVFQVRSGMVFWEALGQIGVGVIITFLLIPLHEALHGLVYYLQGARKIHYTANFRKFYFTAQADQFVVSERGFYWLAFTPFVVIGASSLILGLLFPPLLLPTAAILTLHSTFCGGDFALAAYFYRHRGQGLLTYDDVEAKEAYFFLPD